MNCLAITLHLMITDIILWNNIFCPSYEDEFFDGLKGGYFQSLNTEYKLYFPPFLSIFFSSVILNETQKVFILK